MYANWPCPAPDGGTHEEHALCLDKSRELRVLVIPPLFDEANKMRHQLFEVMRRLDLSGIDSICPDLPGCNESLQPLHAQTLEGWRDAASGAAAHFSATHILAVRGGCLLAPDPIPAWHYAPVSGEHLLRTMLRARVVASQEAGREETTQDLVEMGSREGIELAGWRLGAQMFGELRQASPRLGEHHQRLELDETVSAPLWLKAEPEDDPEQADAIADRITIELLG